MSVIKTVRELYNEGMELFHPELTGGVYITSNDAGEIRACAYGVIEMGATHNKFHDVIHAGIIHNSLGLTDLSKTNSWKNARRVYKDGDVEFEGYNGYSTFEYAFDTGIVNRNEFTIDQLLDMAQARVDWERNAETIAT